ncbi:MAG: DEAD/DEAH box helicase [Simkaniaceae bacterium]|nr:MAG: DEAD/DEAH box helicase [Simkaniaceae bacterium]
MTFDTLSLHPDILKAVNKAGYTTPTKIQSKAIPIIMGGSDIRASAQTGTGKTAAFLLPALNLLSTPAKKEGKGPRILILVPTRELAMQITVQAEKYSKFLNRVKTVCVVGGVPYPKQVSKLSRPYDILIATPGRLIDFMDRGKIDFSRIEMVVLDEADRMLDMGFVKPVEQIVSKTPASRQMLMFSATLQGEVIKLSKRLLNDPLEIKVDAEHAKHENIKQTLHFVDDRQHKNRLLDHILMQDGVDNTIIFTSTKRYADQLVRELKDKEFPAAALHGDMNQRQRTRTIQQLRNGKINVLVATDVAARGIDVQSITHVINFDLPNNVEDYVHRIGRTGRAGASGTALSFVAGRDAFLVKKIKEFTGQPISVEVVSGLEPKKKQASSEDSPRRPRKNAGFKRRFKSGPGPKKTNSRKPQGKKPSNRSGRPNKRHG